MIVFFSFRSLGFVLFILGLVALLFLSPRQGHGETAESLRTASWYAAHPATMRHMRAACIDDPGHGARTPDCINSRAGEWIEAVARARRAVIRPAPPVLSPFDQLPLQMARRP